MRLILLFVLSLGLGMAQITQIPSGVASGGAGVDTIATYYTGANSIAPMGTATDGFYWNGALVGLRNDGIGVTATVGVLLENVTAAAAGAQQQSPSLEFSGRGWKTNATAASQQVQWRLTNVPVEGAAAPQARLDFGYAINGGAFATTLSLLNGLVGIGDTTPSETLTIAPSGGGQINFGSPFAGYAGFTFANAAVTLNNAAMWSDGNSTRLNTPAGTSLAFLVDNSQKMMINSSGFVGIGTTTADTLFSLGSTGVLSWRDSSTDTGLSRNAAGIVEVNNGTGGTFRDLRLRTPTADTYKTATNCADSAGAAACGSAAAGAFVVDASASTVVVSTTAVTNNSRIFVFFDSGLGAELSVTCNTTIPALYGVTARTAATSFTLTATAPVTNPACFSYWIVN